MQAPNEKLTSQTEDYSRIIWIGLGLVLLLILLLGIYWYSDNSRLARASEKLLSSRILRGDEIYTNQCSSCHGMEGEGGVGPALRDRELLKSTFDQVFFSVIRSGVPNTQMPAWSVDFGGPLTDEDIRNLVALMRSWEDDAPTIEIEARLPDPALGAVTFASTCAVCHGEDGMGGVGAIPAINNPDRLANLDDGWYRDVIANGRPARGMPTWGTVLSPEQLDDLVALIAAWRAGDQINPTFSTTDLIDRARFALGQGDTSSALLHLNRASRLSSSTAREMLASVIAAIETDDVDGAAQELASLRENWPPGDPAGGALLYSANCAVCHGPQGSGGVGPALMGSEFIQATNNADLVKFLQEGRLGTIMVSFSDRLSSDEMADLVAFLRLWQE